MAKSLPQKLGVVIKDHPEDDVWIKGGPFDCSAKLICREITPTHPYWEEFEFEKYDDPKVKKGSVLLTSKDGVREEFFVATDWIQDLPVTTFQPGSAEKPAKA